MKHEKPLECDWIDRGVIGRHALSKKLQKQMCQLCGRRHARLSSLTSSVIRQVHFTLPNGVDCNISKLWKPPHYQISFAAAIMLRELSRKHTPPKGLKAYGIEFTVASKKITMYISCSCPRYVVDYLMHSMEPSTQGLVDYWVFNGKKYPSDERYTHLFVEAIKTNTPPEIVTLVNAETHKG